MVGEGDRGEEERQPGEGPGGGEEGERKAICPVIEGVAVVVGLGGTADGDEDGPGDEAEETGEEGQGEGGGPEGRAGAGGLTEKMRLMPDISLTMRDSKPKKKTLR